MKNATKTMLITSWSLINRWTMTMFDDRYDLRKTPNPNVTVTAVKIEVRGSNMIHGQTDGVATPKLNLNTDLFRLFKTESEHQNSGWIIRWDQFRWLDNFLIFPTISSPSKNRSPDTSWTSILVQTSPEARDKIAVESDLISILLWRPLLLLLDTVSAINPNWGFWWLNDKTNRDSNKFAPSMYTVILQTGEAHILWV
jgi:hypothetical protein